MCEGAVAENMAGLEASLRAQEVVGCSLLAEGDVSVLSGNVKQKWRNMGECRIRIDWVCRHFTSPRKLTCKYAYTNGIRKATLWKEGSRRKQTHSLKAVCWSRND